MLRIPSPISNDDFAFQSAVVTPAFFYSEPILRRSAEHIRSICVPADCRFLYSTKAMHLSTVVNFLSRFVDGFSVSSAFEARLASEFASAPPIIHYVRPVLEETYLDEIVGLCECITVNSVSQLDGFADRISSHSEIGLRINPSLSFASDERYNPCRNNSKLGVPLNRFAAQLREEPNRFRALSGIHFHSNCDSNDLTELISTIGKLEAALGESLARFQWLNVGGGYTFAPSSATDQLASEFRRLSRQYGLTVIVEPGAAIVRSSGYFVSTIQDIILGDDFPIAILDFTVNHWPEIFEYQFEPDVEGHVEDGQFTYVLAGCSCLAGDVFGEYSFNEPLQVGSRIVFPNAGAYSIVKANMFNGINLPNIYVVTDAYELSLVKQFGYEDFLSRNGADINACFGT